MRLRSLALLAASIALFGAAAAVAHRIRIASDAPYDVSFVPRASAMRWLSLGHPTLAANLWWLRTVQYMGEERGDVRGWEKLYPLVSLVTDLDPRHGYAYQTTGNVLASAGRLDESNAILEKGTRLLGNRYILPFQRAVNAFLYAGDFAEAGRWFEVAAATPGAPPRLREYVVATYVKGDAADAALGFLQRLHDEAQDDESRRAVQLQMKRAIYERDADRLESAAEAWVVAFGVRPVALASLVLDGFVREVPRDPYGGVYYLDAEGRVRSTAFADRFARPPSRAERNRALAENRANIERAMELNR